MNNKEIAFADKPRFDILDGLRGVAAVTVKNESCVVAIEGNLIELTA